MANANGSTGITRAEWQALGFDVDPDGTMHWREPAADAGSDGSDDDASPILEMEEVPRPIVEDWCLCCDSVNGSPCMCETEDCGTCTDPDCECCSSPQEAPARRRGAEAE